MDYSTNDNGERVVRRLSGDQERAELEEIKRETGLSGTYALDELLRRQRERLSPEERERRARKEGSRWGRLFGRASQELDFEPRPIPEGALRTRPMSIRRLAKMAGEDAKADRFIARFIRSSAIAAKRHSARKWVFDADELIGRWPTLREFESELLARAKK